jgi:hypothetical protein
MNAAIDGKAILKRLLYFPVFTHPPQPGCFQMALKSDQFQ